MVEDARHESAKIGTPQARVTILYYISSLDIMNIADKSFKCRKKSGEPNQMELGFHLRTNWLQRDKTLALTTMIHQMELIWFPQ